MNAQALARLLCLAAGVGSVVIAWPALGWAGVFLGVLLALPERWLGRTRGLPWSLLTTVVIVAATAMAWVGGAELAAASVLLYLMMHWRCVAETEHEQRFALALALLMLTLAVARAPGHGLALLVWGFAVLLPVALGAGGGWRRWGAHVVLLVALSLPLVLAVGDVGAKIGPPRVFSATATGLDVEGARFGDVAALLQRRGEVLRARFSPEPTAPIYLRGVTFDAWDGEGWSRDPSPGTLPAGMGGGDGALIHAEIELFEPLDGVLFTAGAIQEAGWEGGPLYVDPDGDLLLPGAQHLAYQFSARAPLGAGGEVLPDLGPDPRWTVLAPDRDPRLGELARELVDEAEDQEAQVERLVAGIQSLARYTRTPGHAAGAPLPWFLFNAKEGHCEYFATALVLLARELDIPARYVVGYVGGERHEDGGYWVFREAHAHAWAEIYLPNHGWRVVDATPQASLAPTHVSAVGVELDALTVGTQAPHRAGSGLLAAMAGASLLAIAVGWRAARARAPRSVAAAHARARRALVRLGWQVPSSLPPVEAAEWVRARAAGEASDALVELAWLHYRVRYGEEEDAPLTARARECARAVSELGPPPF